jgi:hypothetical protein
VWNLIAVLALAMAAPADVTATKLDGTAVTGALRSWTADEVVVATAGGKQSVPVAELLSLQFSAEPSVDAGHPIIELVDGSVLPIAKLTTDKQQAVFALQPTTGPQVNAKLPLENVRAARWQLLESEALSQWQEIRNLGLPSDLVVVVKRGGKSVDYLECTLGEVSDDEVEFKLDGESMRVPRAKVAGVVFYRNDGESDATPVGLVSGGAGLRIAASALRWQGETLHAKTLDGLEFDWPIAGITSVDLSAGKVVFLSDAKPATALWQPLVGLPPSAKRAAKFGTPRFNESGYGGPLALAYPDASASPDAGETKTFAKGLALRSRSEIVYRMPRGYARFLAVAGIDPAAAANGNVMLTIYGDDRLLVEAALSGNDAPLPIELDVADVKRLRIVVDYGQNLDTGDWLNLCNARLVK